jgi:hypothetical protein
MIVKKESAVLIQAREAGRHVGEYSIYHWPVTPGTDVPGDHFRKDVPGDRLRGGISRISRVKRFTAAWSTRVHFPAQLENSVIFLLTISI